MPASPRPAEGGRRREGGEEEEGDVAVRSGCPFARSLALTGARRPPPVLALPPCQPRPPPSFPQPASGHLMVTRFRKYGSRRRPRSGRADGGAAGGWRQRRGSLAPPPRDEGKGSHVTRERVTWLSRAGEGGRGPPCRCGGVEGGGGVYLRSLGAGPGVRSPGSRPQSRWLQARTVSRAAAVCSVAAPGSWATKSRLARAVSGRGFEYFKYSRLRCGQTLLSAAGFESLANSN